MHYAHFYSGNSNGSSKKLCNIRIMHYYVMHYEQVDCSGGGRRCLLFRGSGLLVKRGAIGESLGRVEKESRREGKEGLRRTRRTRRQSNVHRHDAGMSEFGFG